MAGVYWRGQDGNIYMRQAGVEGVRSTTPEKFAQYNFNNLQEIADPVNPGGASAPSGGGGGRSGGSSAPQINQAAIDNTQRTIDELPGLLKAALEAEGQRYRNTIGGFDTQEKQQRGTYNESTTTNQLNYDSNFMDSIRAGIKGLGGLFALLRGTGAGGGSVEGDVRDIVGGVTANDIRAGADTQKENQAELDTSLSTFLTDLGLKRRQNEDTFENNQRAIRRDNATQMQDLFSKMAGFYGDADRTAERDSWMSRAGSLTPEIAANSRTQVSKYDNAPVVVAAPKLTAFAEPTQPSVVTAPSDGQVGSGIFTISGRKKTERSQTPVLTGA